MNEVYFEVVFVRQLQGEVGANVVLFNSDFKRNNYMSETLEIVGRLWTFTKDDRRFVSEAGSAGECVHSGRQ